MSLFAMLSHIDLAKFKSLDKIHVTMLYITVCPECSTLDCTEYYCTIAYACVSPGKISEVGSYCDMLAID